MKSCALLSVIALVVARIPASTAATTPPVPAATNTVSPPPNTPPVGSGPSGPQGGNAGGGGAGVPPQQPPPLPVWAQCLSQVQNDAPQDSSVASLFKHWCSNKNYETVIPCLETGLVTEAARNPLDNFVKLHFDAAMLRKRSADLCQSFQGRSSNLQCMQQNNATLEAWCRGRFSQGLQYVFAVQLQRAFEPDVYRTLACQVTTDTTGCLGTAMQTCSSDVKRDVLAYYALFTNETCVADPDAEYTTPAPPPTRPPPHDTVLMCARQVAETLPESATLADDASQLDQLIHGLKQNCRTFEARYNCYNEELNNAQAPSFRDLWLSFTFNRENAIKAQKEFCDGFEGGVIGSLNAQCYNETQPRLQECEVRYSQEVMGLEREWATQRIDNTGLHQAACAASLRRAYCLRNAFQLCGVPLAEVMLNSELGTLPDICLTLLKNDQDTTISPATNDNRPPPAQPSDGPEETGGNSYSSDTKLSDMADKMDDKSSQRDVSANDATGAPSTGGDGGSAATRSVVSSLALVAFSALSCSRLMA